MKTDEKKHPVEPFRDGGKFYSIGWNIPIKWCVDADGQCWVDNGHGGALRPPTADALMSEMRGEHDEDSLQQVRGALGLPAEEPTWMRLARAAGWTPPEDSR